MRVLSQETFKIPYDLTNKDDQIEQCLNVFFSLFFLLFPLREECKSNNNISQASIFVQVGGFVMFSSPVVQSRALAYYFSETTDKPANLGAFIIAVVQRFSTRQLRNTEGKDTKSRLMGGQWQQEFYRAAASLLPSQVVISPEYGREQGAGGQLDFYIAEYQWMIEILHEGLAMPEHERQGMQPFTFFFFNFLFSHDFIPSLSSLFL